MNWIRLTLKGDYSPSRIPSIDEGYCEEMSKDRVVLVDNFYGLNRRVYYRENIARIDCGQQ